MRDIQGEQQQASPHPGHGHHPAAAGSLRPSPYDLYIGFQEVAALWACETEHPDELVYRCAFQSIEMGLALLVDAARDGRPAARRDARIQALADNAIEQVALARRLVGATPLPPGSLIPTPADSPSLGALRGLGPAHRDVIRRLTDAVLVAEFPAPLGIEPQLAALRACFGLAVRGEPRGPFLPYARWVRPDRVAALVERPEHGPEDRLFATVHQMAECWLRLVLEHFARAERLVRADEPRWGQAAEPLERAGHILDFLGRHIELLHVMVCADYHPLRVALRGASGAQSAAARAATMAALEFLPPMLKDLESRGLAALDVYRFPHEHAAEHRYLEAVGVLERRLMGFYFQHFQLARKVLGTKSLGSLGYEVRALAERFTKPMFLELDEARFDHVMLTNLAHGGEAGKLIAEREAEVVLPAPPPAPAAGVALDVARATLGRYFGAINAFDLDAWVATFHPEGTMEDPVGSRPHRGTAELKVFFLGVQRTFARLAVDPGELELSGNRAKVRWQARGTAYNGRDVAFEGTEVFDLAPDGRLLAVRVWWDPSTLVGQLLGEAPATA